jgi:hypothetical protein
MSGEEIGKLPGTPSRALTFDKKPVWYTSYPGIGNGSVMFSRDGHTAAGWQHLLSDSGESQEPPGADESVC